MEKGSKVTDYLKDTMRSLLGGVAKSMVGSNTIVPALAPIPKDEVDTSYGSLDPIDLKKEEDKDEEGEAESKR